MYYEALMYVSFSVHLLSIWYILILWFNSNFYCFVI